jgi:hypothetical protein
MPNIRCRVGIAGEPATVLEALTTAEGIRNRWSSEIHRGASEGGTSYTASRSSWPARALSNGVTQVRSMIGSLLRSSSVWICSW